jgi:hypothetical protein
MEERWGCFHPENYPANSIDKIIIEVSEPGGPHLLCPRGIRIGSGDGVSLAYWIGFFQFR